MPNQPTRGRFPDLWADFINNYLDGPDEEMMIALVTAAALVARADGSVEPIERRHLIDFVGSKRLLPRIGAGEILESFDAMAAWLDDQGGAATDVLRAISGRHAALVFHAAERVALADGHLHPGERRALRFIRHTLGQDALMVRRERVGDEQGT